MIWQSFEAGEERSVRQWTDRDTLEAKDQADDQEVNPSLLDPVSIDQTVAVGCSLARAAMGETLL